MDRAEPISAPDAQSSDTCRHVLEQPTTHSNSARRCIHKSDPRTLVRTCCRCATAQIRNCADLRNVQIGEVIRGLSLHKTSALQNPIPTCRASSCVSATPGQGMQVCKAMGHSISKLSKCEGRVCGVSSGGVVSNPTCVICDTHGCLSGCCKFGHAFGEHTVHSATHAQGLCQSRHVTPLSHHLQSLQMVQCLSSDLSS